MWEDINKYVDVAAVSMVAVLFFVILFIPYDKYLNALAIRIASRLSKLNSTETEETTDEKIA